MQPRGKQSAQTDRQRSLQWIQQEGYSRFGCSGCGWSHPSPSRHEDPASLDAIVLGFITRAFLQHLCARYEYGSLAAGPSPSANAASGFARKSLYPIAGNIRTLPLPEHRNWFRRLIENPRTRKAHVLEFPSAAAH